ncbi:unnamed protein product [Durusdinium trenchii]|uniref:BD-FAE-like domain-containing protein n=1 Tax=Durusdinium trenchii TaxID=1381693 RepID=A0ABP0QFP3_9DINO
MAHVWHAWPAGTRFRRFLACMYILLALLLSLFGTWPGFTVQEVRYGPERLHTGDLLRPSCDPRGVVMLIHGGFWKSAFDRRLMVDLAKDLVDRGLAVWNVDYRSVGDGGGYPETLEDVTRALNWLRSSEASELQVNQLPVAVVGHSAGGHLATWLGLQRLLDEEVFKQEVHPRVVISQAGVLDLLGAYDADLGNGAVRDFLGTTLPKRPTMGGGLMDLLSGPKEDAEVRSANSDPMQLLQRVQIPTVRDTDPLTVVLIHGLHDLHVPSEQSRAFHSACVQRDEEHGFSCMLKEVPDEAHFEHLQPDSKLWAAAVDVLTTYL